MTRNTRHCSVTTGGTPLPVSGVHDIFVFPELEQDTETSYQSVQWPEGRYAHAASHITGTVFVMIGGGVVMGLY